MMSQFYPVVKGQSIVIVATTTREILTMKMTIEGVVDDEARRGIAVFMTKKVKEGVKE